MASNVLCRKVWLLTLLLSPGIIDFLYGAGDWDQDLIHSGQKHPINRAMTRASPLPTSASPAMNLTRHPAKTSSSVISDSQRAVSSRLETTPTPSLTSSHLISECLIKSVTAHLMISFGRDHIEQDYSVRMWAMNTTSNFLAATPKPA